MNLFEIFLLSIGLSMDAFSVAVCEGINFKENNLKNSFMVAIYFGFFQCIMPIIGYYLSEFFRIFIMNIGNIISFILLFIIGINMLLEIKEEKIYNINLKTIIILAFATSIDALISGITLSILNVNIFLTSIIIGLNTFILSFIGSKLGNKFGIKYHKISQMFGGIILILISLKILLNI